jgi:hypothetical protein
MNEITRVTNDRRRFRIADGLILIIATGIGLGWSKSVIGPVLSSESFPYTRSGVFLLSAIAFLHVLISWCFTLFLLRWVPPRPDRKEIFSQPGAVAMFSTTLGVIAAYTVVGSNGFQLAPKFAMATGLRGVRMTADVLSQSQMSLFIFLNRVIPIVCGAVSLSWLMLALAGRWRAEPSWIDRTGGFFGAIFVVGLPVFWWISIFT